MEPDPALEYGSAALCVVAAVLGVIGGWYVFAAILALGALVFTIRGVLCQLGDRDR